MNFKIYQNPSWLTAVYHHSGQMADVKVEILENKLHSVIVYSKECDVIDIRFQGNLIMVLNMFENEEAHLQANFFDGIDIPEQGFVSFEF